MLGPEPWALACRPMVCACVFCEELCVFVCMCAFTRIFMCVNVYVQLVFCQCWASSQTTSQDSDRFVKIQTITHQTTSIIQELCKET